MEALTLQSEPAEWEAVAPYMALAADGCERDVRRIREQIERGAMAFTLSSATTGETVGAFVADVEVGMLEVVAAGANPGLSLLDKVLPAIESTAKNFGLSGMVVHTYRRGMVERLAGFGYGTAYVAMVKEFNV